MVSPLIYFLCFATPYSWGLRFLCLDLFLIDVVHYSFLSSYSQIYYAAKEAVGADETPSGGWSVTRLRSAAHGTLNIPGLSLGVGPKGGLGEHGDAVSRQLILTKVSLVERRPENYEVS